jgi:hypothetical protein
MKGLAHYFQSSGVTRAQPICHAFVLPLRLRRSVLLATVELDKRRSAPMVLKHWRRNIETNPSQAAKSRPLAKAAPFAMAATIALAMSGPMPGTVISCRQLSLPCTSCSISSVNARCAHQDAANR